MKITTNEKGFSGISQQWAGMGTNADPYQITSVNDLKSLAQYVNTGNITKDLYYILKNDIDMKGVSDFIPIGGWNADGRSANYNYYFQGKLDGNNKVISNLSIQKDMNIQGNTRIGLFGYIVGDANNHAEIKNLGVINSVLSGYNYVGALCGEISFASIEKVYATGSINATMVSGGLFGLAKDSIIKDSYTKSEVAGGYMNGDKAIGGFCGSFCGENSNNNSIINCYSTGHCSGNDCIGGFCGINGGSISKSYFNGSAISGNDTVGGFCGKNSSGKIDKCFVGKIRVIGHYYIGGFCGENYNSKINNSYALAEVHADDYAGGFCGKNDYLGSLIQNSYAAGSIQSLTIEGKTSGGFEGVETNGANIKNSYRESSMVSHNKKGTEISASDMKGTKFINLLNNGQNPQPWKADYADPRKANNGFPILDFQEPVNPDAYVEVTTTVEYGSHSRGSKNYPAKIIGSYTEHYSTVISKGFMFKYSDSTEWTTKQVDGADFKLNTSVSTTYYDYKAYVINEFGKTYYGDLVSVGTSY
jgi:hypothetical protein